MESIQISKFIASDIEDAYSLIQDTITQCYSGIYRENAVKYFQSMYTRERINRKSITGTTVVARSAGTIIGIGSALGSEISGVFVSSDFQGKGVGRAIMAALEKHIVEANWQFCTLSVSLPSFNFYKALSYEQFSEQEIDVGDGQKLHYWQASKKLLRI